MLTFDKIAAFIKLIGIENVNIIGEKNNIILSAHYIDIGLHFTVIKKDVAITNNTFSDIKFTKIKLIINNKMKIYKVVMNDIEYYDTIVNSLLLMKKYFDNAKELEKNDTLEL